MLDPQTLRDLLNRVLKGDEAARTELVRQMDPVIRRAVRVHLPLGHWLRRFLDSEDIRQSVLHDFFSKAGAEAFRFLNPEQLPNLLWKMAQDKTIDKLRQAEAARRGGRGYVAGGTALRAGTGQEAEPSEIAEGRDLYWEIRRRLKRPERTLADLWAAGHTFPEIAERLGEANGGRRLQANAVRMALERAFAHLARLFSERWREDVPVLVLKAMYLRGARQLTREESENGSLGR